MKFKTTKTAIMNGYYKVFSIGYCSLQNLLSYQSPIAYTSGTYGHNADIYQVGAHSNIAIVTGYRPFGQSVSYNLVDKYETLARAITSDYSMDYTERQEQLQLLLDEFVTEILQ